jgi:hypothetical protein
VHFIFWVQVNQCTLLVWWLVGGFGDAIGNYLLFFFCRAMWTMLRGSVVRKDIVSWYYLKSNG